MKPMLADDWDDKRQRFPVIAQPKIDGVRGLNLFGKLTGRSLKPFKNRHVTTLFSHSALTGLDGEFAAQHECHPDLCRLTTSALGTIEGEPYVLWHLFDYVTAETKNDPYKRRRLALTIKVNEIMAQVPAIGARLRVVTQSYCNSLADVLSIDQDWTRRGYEGTILRDPDGAHKSGRSTIKEGGLLRIKRFMDAEGVVIAVHEGETNNNEATANALGHTERSTHQANMVSNGLIGTLTVQLVAPLEAGGKLFSAGEIITVSAGKMTSEERAFYLLHPGEIVGRVVKFQYFPHGVKDKLRFPTFQSIRMKEDLS